MPELPEIEALREAIAARHLGQTVAGLRLRQFALVKSYDPPLEGLEGATLEAVQRTGKHLHLHVSGGRVLAIHLGIGGRIVPIEREGKHSGGRALSLTIEWDSGQMLDIVELGTKKRSSVKVLTETALHDHFQTLGPDALSGEMTSVWLAEALATHRVQTKGFLTDQRQIAGIGNAYSDEILWEAGLAPLRLAPTLSTEEIERLHASIGTTLQAAIERARGDNYLTIARGDKRGAFHAHRREGEPCSRCGDAIASIHFAERSLQYCPSCQADGKRYADRRLSRLLK